MNQTLDLIRECSHTFCTQKERKFAFVCELQRAQRNDNQKSSFVIFNYRDFESSLRDETLHQVKFKECLSSHSYQVRR